MTAQKSWKFTNIEFPSQIYTCPPHEGDNLDSSELSETGEKRQSKKKSLYKKRSDMRPDQLERARERDRLSQQRRRARERWFHIQRGEAPPRKPSTRKPRSEMTSEELEILREKERVAQQNRRARARLKQFHGHTSHSELLKKLCMYQSKSNDESVENGVFNAQEFEDFFETSENAISSSSSVNDNAEREVPDAEQEKLDYMRGLDLQLKTGSHYDTEAGTIDMEQHPTFEDNAHFYKNELESRLMELGSDKLQSEQHSSSNWQEANSSMNANSTAYVEFHHSLLPWTTGQSNDGSDDYQFQGKVVDRSKLSHQQLEQLRKRERDYQRARRARMRMFEPRDEIVELPPRRKLSLQECGTSFTNSDELKRSRSYPDESEFREYERKSSSKSALYKNIPRRNTRNVDRSTLSKVELERLRKAEREYQRHRRERIRASKISQSERFNAEQRSDSSDSGAPIGDRSEELSRTVSDASNDSQTFAIDDDDGALKDMTDNRWPEIDCSKSAVTEVTQRKQRKKVSLEDICVSLKSLSGTDGHVEECLDNIRSNERLSSLPPTDNVDHSHANDDMLMSEERDVIEHLQLQELSEAMSQASPIAAASHSMVDGRRAIRDKPIGEEWKSWRAGLSSEQLERRRRSNREAQRRRRARMKGVASSHTRKRVTKRSLSTTDTLSDHRLDNATETQDNDTCKLREMNASPIRTVSCAPDARSRDGSLLASTGCRIKVTPQRSEPNGLIRYGGDGQMIAKTSLATTTTDYAVPSYIASREWEADNNNEEFKSRVAVVMKSEESIADQPHSSSALTTSISSKRKQHKPRRINTPRCDARDTSLQ